MLFIYKHTKKLPAESLVGAALPILVFGRKILASLKLGKGLWPFSHLSQSAFLSPSLWEAPELD